MKPNIIKLIFLSVSVICVFFGFANNAKADYETFGLFVSTNLLTSSSAEIINNFSYTIAIPSGTTAVAQFSLDNATWYNSSGVLDGTNTLSAGTNIIDLSSLGWNGSEFYYRMIFTSDGTATPSLDSITLSYIDFTGSYNIYNTSGSLTSTNLFLGTGASAINSFYYNIALPPNTSATIQFSIDNTNWYNSSGVLDGSNALSGGANTINLSSLNWYGSAFYYKISLVSDGTYSPTIYSITLNYTSDTISPTTTADAGSYTFDTWTNSNATVSLACDDGIGSGCSVIKYCQDTENSCTPTTTYTSAITISTENTSYLRYFSTDNSSNEELIKSQTIKIDTTSPIITNTLYTLGSLSDTQLATITWATSEASSTQVEYGATNTYGQTTTEQDTDSRVASHTATLTIPACSIYHLRTISKDIVQNSSASQDFTIQTHCATPGHPLANYTVGSVVSQSEPVLQTQEPELTLEPEQQTPQQPTQAQTQALITEIKAKIQELMQQLILLLQERINNR